MTELPCHTASERAGETEIGSAPTAAAWVCLEQPGPWGAKAFTQSHLDPEIGGAFEERAQLAGVRPQLIRRPGPHADRHTTRRHILVASTAPGSSWLMVGEVEHPERVLDLDLVALAAGERPDWPELAPMAEPVLLVCTNGRRDVCCARLGREVAARTNAAAPGRVWEANHLSGHRFAATTALLPSGHLHGRVLDADAILRDADHGRLTPMGWRGRSSWDAAGQVAEALIREREDLWEIDAVAVKPHGSGWQVCAGAATWTVEVTQHTDGMAPPSCGKAPEPVRRYVATVQ